MFARVDHIVCVVSELTAASEPHERLGLTLTPPSRFESSGIANRALFVGNSAESLAYLELVGVLDDDRARRSGRSAYVGAEGAVGLVFGVDDVSAESARLAALGFDAPVESVDRPDGSRVIDIATIDTRGAIPFRVSIACYPESWDERYNRSKDVGRLAHSFPLKRLDHLAAVAPDLEGATRFWDEVLGVPAFGEVKTPGMIIRQLKIGDAILELLGPASADSPIASRSAALASMAAWEVEGALADAVALARDRGFTVSNPEAGVIPGTRRASIPAAELGGIGMQLLEYL